MLEKISQKVKTVSLTAGAVVVGAVPAFAEGEGVANAAVTGAFTGLANDIIATIGVVAVAAVGVAAVFLGFKYGRKILNSVAK